MPTLKEIYIKFYTKLVTVLPMDDTMFVAQLYSNDLLPGNGKARVQAKQTQADKASCFLDEFVERGFIDDNTNPTFYSLLSIMQSSDDPLLKSMAGTIRESNCVVCVCVCAFVCVCMHDSLRDRWSA